MNRPADAIQRYAFADRAMHWLIALGFILAALSGLVLFHPSMFFLSHLFGGGTWTRILHPFLGLFMAFFFFSFALKIWRHNLIGADDRRWLAKAAVVMAGHEEGVPDAGKYNAGQKVLFWLLALCMLGLLLTGFVFWRPYLAGYFPIWLVRIATLLHAVSAAGLIMLVLGHIYMSIWTTYSIRAMMFGWVTRAWAKKHHAAWYREMTR